MFLYSHSKFEREITNVIASFLMGISTSHYVQAIAKYLPFSTLRYTFYRLVHQNKYNTQAVKVQCDKYE